MVILMEIALKRITTDNRDYVNSIMFISQYDDREPLVNKMIG